MDRKEICGSCRYWQELGQRNAGECRQCPGPIYRRTRQFWCGSYAGIPANGGLRAVNETLRSATPKIEVEPTSPLDRAIKALQLIEETCLGMGESTNVRTEVERIAGEILADLEEGE